MVTLELKQALKYNIRFLLKDLIQVFNYINNFLASTGLIEKAFQLLDGALFGSIISNFILAAVMGIAMK